MNSIISINNNNNFSIEFTCLKFKAFYQIVSSFMQICPPIINITLLKHRLIFTSNSKDEAGTNQLIYIIYLDNSTKIKISPNSKQDSINKSFNLSCTLIKLLPIVLNLFKPTPASSSSSSYSSSSTFAFSQSPITWTVLHQRSNWLMTFTAPNIKFELPVDQNDQSSFSFLEDLDTKYLLKINYTHFTSYYSQTSGIFWFNPIQTKMISEDKMGRDGILSWMKGNDNIEINQTVFQQTMKAKGIRVVNEPDLYGQFIGMKLTNILIKFIKKEIIDDNWLYLAFSEVDNQSKQLTYMLNKNDQGNVEDVAIHLGAISMPLKSVGEVLNHREKGNYAVQVKKMFNQGGSSVMSSIDVLSKSSWMSSAFEKEGKGLGISANSNLVNVSNDNNNKSNTNSIRKSIINLNNGKSISKRSNSEINILNSKYYESSNVLKIDDIRNSNANNDNNKENVIMKNLKGNRDSDDEGKENRIEDYDNNNNEGDDEDNEGGNGNAEIFYI